jgi:hypothetical protein
MIEVWLSSPTAVSSAEMHDNTNQVFIIVDGEAEFITGSKMIDPKVRPRADARDRYRGRGESSSDQCHRRIVVRFHT